MNGRIFAVTAGLGCIALLAGCGSDYEPPHLETTGRPASPLGQVVDLELTLPDLHVPGAFFRGVRLEARVEIEADGLGQHAARVFFGPATAGGGPAELEDLSDGRTTVTITPEDWITGILGPLLIDGMPFELLLRGDTPDAGWTVEGDVFETRGATVGSFEGWRRHRFLVAQTDFAFGLGRVAEVALIKNQAVQVRQALEIVTSDTVLRVTGRAAFAVNRFTFDNLQRLDPLEDFSTTWQKTVGEGANPHDVLLVSDETGYVTRYEPPFNDIRVFDPKNGKPRATIPLAELAENPDGTPRPDRFAMAGGTVFVGLQDIDRSFEIFAEGKLAVIDPLLDEVVGVIPLGGKNPGAIEVLRGQDGRERLYVALAGVFAPPELSGGVVVVDVTNRAVERMALDDDVAGGNIGAMAMASEDLGYVVVSDEFFHNRVWAFDPREAELLREVRDSAEYIPELEVDTSGVLAVPDRAFFEPRLCLYRLPGETDGEESLIGCGPLELPPFSVEALD